MCVLCGVCVLCALCVCVLCLCEDWRQLLSLIGCEVANSSDWFWLTNVCIRVLVEICFGFLLLKFEYVEV